MEPLKPGPILQFLRQRRAPSRFPRWLPDLDRSALAGGSMIRHAPEAAAFPVVPLAVAVIEPSLPALLVSLVGPPPLFPPCFLSAPVPAVAMPPVAGTCRCKTPTRNPASGKTTAATPLLWPSHPARVWTTALLRGLLAMPWSCPRTGAAIKKPPIVAAIGGFPFHLRPCLAGASANRRLQCVPTPSRSSSCHTLSALRRESEMVAGTGRIEGS